jgi:microcystin-dependent protein
MYGVGDGTTTFNVPNLKGRFPLGKADSGTGATLGGTGGQIDHTHGTKPHYHEMGTGATLNITASGGGNTDYASTGVTAADTNINHTHSGQTNTDGAHNHDAIEAATADSGSGTIDNIRITGGTQVNTTIDSVILTTGSSHSHQFTTNLMNSNAIHSHTIVDPTHRHAIQNHTHAAANIAGAIGLVTGGVNGNIQQPTTEANPPFLAVNYIISA